MVWECNGEKTSGWDEFTLKVFLECLDFIKEDMFGVFMEFYDKRLLMLELVFSLIHKNVSSTKVEHQINQLFEILAKVLT